MYIGVMSKYKELGVNCPETSGKTGPEGLNINSPGCNPGME
jgi:hypothetical protein